MTLVNQQGVVREGALGFQPESVSVQDVRLTLGDMAVLRGISLAVPAGHSLALLGPSGCGKTTLLRVIAGLEQPDHGIVRLGEEELTGPDRFVPPERRRVGMVFQDGALFPHLTVAENVAFGLRRSGDRKNRVARALELVGLGTLGDRLPARLSGGEWQRVALARALAPAPEVLLLDEPLASLDQALRVQLRAEVRRLLSDLGITSIFVTHDQNEAFVVGDEVAVMRNGQILQSGTPGHLYERPVDRWVARFVGDANLVRGRVTGDSVETHLGVVPVASGVGTAGARVDVLVRPECLSLQADGPWTVEAVDYYGHDSMYQVAGERGLRLQVRSFTAPHHRPGDRVSVSYAGPPTVAYQTD